MNSYSARGIIALLLIYTASVAAAHAQSKPIANHTKGAFFTGKYRNLFAESGHSPRETKLKLDGAFQQLFHGDPQSQALYFKAGKNANGPLAYICDVLHQDIRSEGVSYGMMIAVQMNKKAEFDALWNYAVTNMYINTPGHPAKGYFAWSVKTNGLPNAETPAPDGEEYFVTALYFASGRWPNGKGIYNYKPWAHKILANMRHHRLTSGPTRFGYQTTGSMVNEQKRMILFLPNGNGPSFSDPSYHLPAFYELWARWGPKHDRSFWAAAADTSRRYFQKAANPVTGLCADYADFEGQPVVTSFNANSQHFAYDSWRTAMNWSVDWAWWHKDTSAVLRSKNVQTFFASKGLTTYGHIYTLQGKELAGGQAAGLVATNATLSLAAAHPLGHAFVEALWQQPVPTKLGERYYGGLLHMMALLHCSGRFRIYNPGGHRLQQ